MGRIYPGIGVQADIWEYRSVDTKQAAVDAACEVEEAEEVPKGHDQQRLSGSGGSQDMDSNEEMAIGIPQRGVVCNEP